LRANEKKGGKKREKTQKHKNTKTQKRKKRNGGFFQFLKTQPDQSN
jgi:hypothetical protein